MSGTGGRPAPSGPALPLSVIVPTRERRDLLLRKLETLSRQTLPPAEFEVVVCDDASGDGTAEALVGADYPFALRVVRSDGTGGAAAARNAAARCARGEVLLMSDDDCLLESRALEAHLGAHRRSPRSVVVGPLRLPEELRDRGRTEPFEQVTAPGRRVSWINATGANTSIPAREFRAVGGYDETFGEYGGEDPDLALRLRARGLRFRFDRRALAYHHGRQLGEGSVVKAYAAGRSSWRVYRRHPSLEVGVMLGVHPLLLVAKSAILQVASVATGGSARIDYERAYLRGAQDARREESEDAPGTR